MPTAYTTDWLRSQDSRLQTPSSRGSQLNSCMSGLDLGAHDAD